MKRLITILALCLWAAPAFAAYSHYRVVTVDHTKVPNTDQTDFPVLVGRSIGVVNTSGTSVAWVSGAVFGSHMAGLPVVINGVSYTVSSVTSTILLTLSTSAGTQTGVAYYDLPFLSQVADGGAVQNANGYDITFTSDNACTTPLDFDLDIYTSTGNLVFWVKVPAVSHTVDTAFYLCYDNGAISTFQGNTSGTWSNSFVAVYHLGDGTTLSVNDATGSFNGTNNGATAVAGKGTLGGAAHFVTGSSQYIALPTSSSLNPSPMTVEAWVDVDNAITSGSTWGISAKQDSGSNNGWAWYAFKTNVGSDALYGFQVVQGGNVTQVGCDVGTPTGAPKGFTNWVFLAGTSTAAPTSSSNFKTYVNSDLSVVGGSCGGSSFEAYAAGSIPTVSDAGRIGSRNSGSTLFYTGHVDELRISSVVRSADWITSEYNNQSAPPAFYSLGSESTPAGTGVRHHVTQD